MSTKVLLFAIPVFVVLLVLEAVSYRLMPDEDAVYSFVTTVARGYLGARVGEWPAAHAGMAVSGG